MNDTIFNLMFTIVPIIVVVVFVFVIVTMFSPKLRGKMLSKQIRATKYMVDEAKDDLQDMVEAMSNVSIQTQKSILDKNEETLKDIATRKANIHKDSIKTTVGAIKEGLSSHTSSIYCKHCGKSIDADSNFCNSCGKKQ